MIELYSELYDFDFSLLRYFSVYGPRQRPDEAFTKFIDMALKGEPVTIYGDGEQSRDFTHVSDIVQGTIKASETGQGTYNLGSQRRVSVNKMIETLNKVRDREVKKKYVERPPGDAEHTPADISQAKKELDYQPEIEFEDGAKDCVRWVARMREKGIELE